MGSASRFAAVGLGLGVLACAWPSVGIAQCNQPMASSFGEALARALTPRAPCAAASPGQAAQGSRAASHAPATGGRISDSFVNGTASGISSYAEWSSGRVVFNAVGFQEGKYQVSWSEMPTSIEVQHRARQERMNTNFSWSDWNANTATATGRFNWSIVCVFDAAAGSALASIPVGSSRIAQVKIRSAQDQRLVFDCRL